MNDLQMARGAVEGGYNLAVGEPVVLQQALSLPHAHVLGPFEYPTIDGDPRLRAELEALHPGHHIVITNGAKQALAAAFYAYREVEGASIVQHNPPYWPSYPTLANMARMTFGDSDWKEKVRCITAPNNPDGSELSPSYIGNPFQIWDSVYAHWVWGWNGKEPPHEVRVCSASKILGLSGVRVGWLATKNKRLADAAARFVEFTTSGVGLLAQRYVADIMELLARVDSTGAYRQARTSLLTNSGRFNYYIYDMCQVVEGVPAHGTGMFAFFQISPPLRDRFRDALVKAKVALVTGAACGVREPDWYRMNLAHDNQYTEEALKALREAL
jgi:aspartate/methionine/tyrosine aminotransferase